MLYIILDVYSDLYAFNIPIIAVILNLNNVLMIISSYWNLIELYSDSLAFWSCLGQGTDGELRKRLGPKEKPPH